MKKFDLNDNNKVIFFSAIGGISLSGIAKLLIKKGFKIYGSDAVRSDLTVQLEEMGAIIYYGQSKENITSDIDLVVHSAAIHRDNEELLAAEKAGIDIWTRAEFLGAIMQNYSVSIGISGTHGKTTTTTMVSDIFLKANKNPTISVGGIMPSINTNFLIGEKDYFITEACEYTNSFLSFYPDTAVILNCELDHTDFFKDEDDFRNSFKLYANNIKNGGKLIINAEITNYKYFENKEVEFITFGIEVEADYTAKNIQICDNSYIRFELYYKGEFLTDIELNTIGKYNVSNALAAIATCYENGIGIDIIKEVLKNFQATQRRFQLMGDIKGVKIISDFAHHPTAVKYAIETARLLNPKKLWVVFQPHAYSRTKEFLNEFAESLSLADNIILTPIYAAREVNTYNVYSSDIANILVEMNKNVYNADDFSEAEDIVLTNTSDGDVVIAMGGGDIDKLAKDLVGISYVK